MVMVMAYIKDFASYGRRAMQVSLGSANMSSSESNPGVSGGLGVVDVSLQSINLFVGGKELIKDAELLVCGGRRYGLIGRNGTGKSSFLRLISAREVSGIPKGLSIMHIEQVTKRELTDDCLCVCVCVCVCSR